MSIWIERLDHASQVEDTLVSPPDRSVLGGRDHRPWRGTATSSMLE
jgi:hypothetical protein